jgi:energy-coupling factor transporter ATP-binding protein EcfA2
MTTEIAIPGDAAGRRAEMIDQILARRAQRADRLGPMLDLVDRIAGAAAGLGAARDALAPAVDGEAAGLLAGIAEGLDRLERRAELTKRELERAEARFRRPTLTIGTIGRSGQGKSTMLQSLTGLGDQEIPSGEGSFMTGVPSHIRHTAGPTEAEIEFHDVRSFLDEVLATYYTALELGPVPESLDEFGAEPLPKLVPGASKANEAAYGHLQQYHEHLPAYRDRLENRVRLQQVPPEEIRRHVAQQDEAGLKEHAFRSVRAVRISTPFGRQELGRLSLVDLPGLGDTNLGDVELLNRALGGEVDVAVFIKRPDRLRYGVDDADVGLYDIARAALPELPLERWSFLLINQESGENGNAKAVVGYRRHLADSRLRYADVVDADCTEPEKVEKAFDSILEHLVTGIDDLDRTLTARRTQDVAALRDEANALVERVRAVAAYTVPDSAWHPRFLELFSTVYEMLADALDELVRDYQSETTSPDPELAGAIRAVLAELEDADAILPTVEELRKRRGSHGAHASVFTHAVDALRAAISRKFLDLDGALKIRVGEMHRDLAQVLLTSGRLAPLSAAPQGLARLDALDAVLPVQQLTRDLRDGLDFVREYTLNYRGLLQHRVRRALAKLDPDRMGVPPDTGPEDIRGMLEEYLHEVAWDIEGELDPILVEPREAVFAVLEEFRDRALRVAHARDGWQVVYESLRTEVWPDEFEALAANTATYRRWRGAVDALAAAADVQLADIDIQAD